VTDISFDDLPSAKPADTGLSFDDLPAAAPAAESGYVPEALKGFARGAQGMVTSPLQGVAAAQSQGPAAIERAGLSAAMDRVMAGEDPAQAVENVRAAPPALPPVTETPGWHAAESFKKATDPYIAPAKGWEDSWTGDIAGGFGSVAAGIGMSILNPAAAMLAFVTAGQGEAAERAVKAGATPEQIQTAARLGTVSGATDVVDALLPMMGSYGKTLGLIKRVGYGAVSGALAEGGQEGLQQFIQNAIAKGIYKPDQDLMEDVPRSAAIGAIVGGSIGGFSGGVQKPGAAPAAEAQQSAVQPTAGQPAADPLEALIAREAESPAPDNPELDALLSDLASRATDFSDRARSGSPVAAPAQAAEPATEPSGAPIDPMFADLPDAEETPQRGPKITYLTPDAIQTDAERFQYKGGADKEGVTSALKDVKKWDDRLAPPILAWESEDGSLYVVNGHQRTALAKRASAAGQPDVYVPARIMREADGYTPEYMRALGAFQNIAEGTGTALDAAKVLRANSADLADVLPPLPPRSQLVQNAKGLADLSDEAFGMVVNDIVPEAYAAQVGNILKEPAEQMAALDVLAKGQPANVDQARIMVEDIRNAGFLKGEQTGLFGAEEFARSLVPERARILDRAVKTLRKLGSTFKTAVEQEGTLAEAGNKLKRAANERAQTENERLAEVLANDGTRKGPISDALSDAARALADGKPINAVTSQFLSQVRSLTRGTRPGVQRSAETDRDGHAREPQQAALYSLGRGQQRPVAPKVRAEIEAMTARNAPLDEIVAHPAVSRAVAEMRRRIPTGTPEQLRDPAWQAKRVYDFGGKPVRGFDAAADRLTEKARSYAGGKVENGRHAVLVLGPPAAGKSTFANPIAKAMGAAVVDADDAKLVIREYQGGVGTVAVHEESSALAGRVASRLIGEGANLVLPKVGAAEASIRNLKKALEAKGYTVDVAHVAANPEISGRRNIGRWLETGRLVDPDYIREVGDKPREVAYILSREGNDYVDVDTSRSPPKIEGKGPLAKLLRDRGERGEPVSRGDGAQALFSLGRRKGVTDQVDLFGGRGDQYVLPGAEKISDAELAQRRADAPLQPKKPQKPAELFSNDDASQLGLGLEPKDGRRDVRQGAQGVSPKQPAGRAQGLSARRRPEQVSLFDWGAGRKPDDRPARPDEQAGGGERPAVPAEGGRVTKPPSIGARNRPRRNHPAAAGLAEAIKKIEERSRLNYRITDSDRIGEGGPKQKVRDNIEAVRVLRQIEEEGRGPTPEEKAKLVKYVGWGAFAQDVFAPHKQDWKKERDALRSLLTDAEYDSAKASTLNAHYTSPEVIRGMWDVMDHFGFSGGLALEPSAGIGHFIGLTPDHVAPKTAWTAVELDAITGRIAAALYGGSEVHVEGYQDLKRPSNYYDLVISNVPFGDYNITEKPYGRYPIHDFFFVKSLDKVRPGGIVAFITSRYTMDRMDPATRREFAKQADLVGAIRLPGGRKGAFAGNAGTEVTTDIIFLRKKVPDEKPYPQKPWLETKEIKTPDGPVKINEYFAANPQMMMGEMRLTGSMYSDKEPVLVGTAEGLRERIAQAARDNMEAGAFLPRGVPEPVNIDSSDVDPTLKEGALFVKNGKVYQRQNGVGVEQKLSPDDVDRVKRLSEMRGTVNDLLAAQLGASDKGTPADLRRSLAKTYEAFVKKWGPINLEERTVTSRVNKEGENVVIVRTPNLTPFKGDPDAWKVSAIEKYDPETGKATPAAIQTKNVIEAPTERQINGPADALAASLDKHGAVDVYDIADMLGTSVEDAVKSLGDTVFVDPDGRQYVTADQYLSGNVVKKLEEARALAQDDASFQRNVDALEKVQPVPLEPSDITAQFGAPWVPEHVYNDFIKDVLGGSGEVKKVPLTGEWRVTINAASRDARAKYATDRVPIDKIFKAAINNQQITVWDQVADDKREVNQKETEAARIKTEAMKEAFAGDPNLGIDGWVWQDGARAAELAAIYNRTYNNLVPTNFDGSHQTLPGLNRMFADRKHRLDAIWRMVTKGNTLLAHVVGSGKTVTMIAGGMEMKRLGLINKPAYVVPNHMLEQFAREFIEAYPNAKIIVAEKDEMTRDNRKAFLAKVAANDWDGVVITHDAFGRINMAKEFRQQFIRDQIAELERVKTAEAKEAGKDSPTVKALEKAKKRLQDKLQKLLNEDRKDEGTSFEESGVDFLFVDEAHKFKNLAFVTRLQRVKGLAQGESQRAEDLSLKIRYLDQKRPGRSAVFATGTPVSNTMAELWTMQRYLQYDKLREADLDTFDAWASTFGKVVNNMELSADGRTLKEVSSFSRFVNVPELVSLYSEIADTKTADMLNLPRPQVVAPDGKPGIEIVKVSPSEAEERYIEGLVKLAEELKGKRPEPGKPNMLSVVGLGRKVATDARLVGLPVNEGGKIATAARNIFQIWKDGKEPGTVQMVFLDMGVPQTKAKPKKADPDGDVTITDTPDPIFAKYNVDLYADLKARLVAMGVPAKQIATIHEATDDQKKAKLFSRVRSGDVRVIIGSSEKMGVGTNVQDRLIAMHHLDAPWKPAEVEQRDGRIVRQGNKNPNVRILRYVTERSFDAFMWQKLDTKSKFIGQVLSGAKGARHAEDIDNPLPEAAEMKAAASGDPRIMELAELDRKVRQLAAQKRVFDASKARAVSELAMTKGRVKQYEDALPAAEMDAAKVEDLSGDKFKVTIQGKEYDDRREAGKVILDALLARDARSYYAPKRIDIGTEMSGFPLEVVAHGRYGDGAAYLAVTPVVQASKNYSGLSDITINDQTDPAGLMLRFGNLLKSIALEPDRIERVLKEERANVPRLEKVAGETWPKDAELQRARADLDALTKELTGAKEEKPAEAAPATDAVDTEGWTAESLVGPDAGFTHWQIRDAAGNPVTKIVGGTAESAIRKAAEKPEALFDISRDLTRLAQKDRGEIERRITAIARQVMGAHVRVAFQDAIPLPDDAVEAWGAKAKGLYTAAGRYIPAHRLIDIAMADPMYRDQVSTAYHELFHGAENLLLRDAEMAVLKAEDAELRQIAADYTGMSRAEAAELAGFEVRAIAAQAYADMRNQPRSVDLLSGAARKVLEKLRQMFKRIRNVMRGLGYQTSQDIFSDFYEGRMAARAAKERPFVREAASVVPGGGTPTPQQRRSVMERMDMRPLDRALRVPFDVFGGTNQKGEWDPGLRLSEKAAKIIKDAKFSGGGKFHWLNPTLERARAGLIDRYGLDPAYVERERQRALDERRIMGVVPEVMQTLKENDVGSAEAIVLQKILTGEQISDANLEALAAPIRQAIDVFGQEAVDLGLLSQESFDRNKGAYLHRVYRKHETDQNPLVKWVSQMASTRRKKIIGNQFKGRGLWKEVAASTVNQAPKGSKVSIGGTQWEVRGYKGKKAVLWRDYTPAERERMGEILDARYTIAKTYMVMAHDLATGRFYKDIADNPEWSSDQEPASGAWKNAAEYGRHWADPDIEWVKVPDTKIASSNTPRYGALAGRFVRAEIWRDINELEQMQSPTWWNTILTQWKLNKTARSPVTHMNNVMSNAVLMDMADVRARDLYRGIRSMVKQDALYKEAVDNGAFGGDMISQEIRDNVLRPILEEIENQAQAKSPVGMVEKVMAGLFSKGALVGAAYGAAGGALVGGPVGAVAGAGVGAVAGAAARKPIDKFDEKMLQAYRLEDEVFRMATYTRRIDQGLTPREAAIEANEQFLDYDIRAPWVNAARRTVLPFIAYTYRATPLVAKMVMTRPWKLAKYATVAFVLNALGYALFPGDEDDERRTLREEEQGRTWIGAPRMIRTPFGDANGNPLFLDVRRWIPSGDIFDMNQGQGAVPVPAPLQFGGPIMLGAELALNKQAFTGRPIVNTKTDDIWDRAGKVGDWAWKAWMPGAAWIPGSWYWEKTGDALAGARDRSGRAYSLPLALSSSVGVKLKPHEIAEGKRQIQLEFDRVNRELSFERSRLARDRSQGKISDDRYKSDLAALDRKRKHYNEERRKRLTGEDLAP